MIDEPEILQDGFEQPEPPLESIDAPAPPRVFRCTDIGNGERLVARFGRDFHYVPIWKTFLLWDGSRWTEDRTKRVEFFAKSTVRAIQEEAKLAPAEERPALFAHMYKSESNKSINAMLSRAMAEPGVAISHTELDRDPWRMTVENGELDLRTAKLTPHRRATLATKYVPIEWNPEARCDRWEAFLHRVLGGSQALINFVQRAVGYSLTGRTDEQCLFFLYGLGKNGKSTFMEVLRALAGEYATQADFTSFLERRGDGPRNDIARLFGARIVTSSEVGENKKLDEPLVKALTGGDTIAARRLYSEAFEFTPTFKLWLAANHKPRIQGTDLGIWRRVRLLPFTVEIPEAERDPHLKDTLLAELPGILAWAVAGCRLWQMDGGVGLPDEVRDATEAYRVESDTLGAFLDEYCEIGAGFSVATGPLYDAYKEWAKDGELYPLTKIAFGRQLAERGFSSEKTGTGARRTIYRFGLRLIRYAAPPAWSREAPALPFGERAEANAEELEV